MRRRETTELFPPRPTAAAAPDSMRIDLRIGLIGLLGMILVLLLGTRAVLAETSESLDLALALESAPPPAAIAFSAEGKDNDRRGRGGSGDGAERFDDAADEQMVIEVAAEVDDALPPAREPSRVFPEELLFMNNSLGARAWRPLTTDEALAVAVAGGTNPDLKPRNPFRKRSSDLFKTKFRQVTILRAEMLMRLRLRAKARKAISVEVRF